MVRRHVLAWPIVVALGLIAVGWVVIAAQHAWLWQRLPASTVDRYVADQIDVALPRLPAATELQAACARPVSRLGSWRRAWLRAELAQCLADPAGLVQGEAAARAIARHEALIASQVESAQAWLKAYDQQAASRRAALRAELASLQAAPATPPAAMQRLASRIAGGAPTEAREAVGPIDAPDRAARLMRERVVATQARVQALAAAARTPGERARDLALMATGQQIAMDYGVAPPQPHLTTDKGALADALEWQRRARGYAERGFSLTRLHGLCAAMAWSALVLVATVALIGRGSAARRSMLVLLWGGVTLLMGAGSLILADVALTGDAALRYLAERQFQQVGLADGGVPLMLTWVQPPWLGQGTVSLWWPLLAVAAGLALLSRVRDGRGRLWAPVRGWVRCSGEPRCGAWQSAALLLAGVLIVAVLGMPAAISELLILLGCVGVASYLARQAPHANAGAGLQLDSAAVVGVALALAVGGALMRGDLGHALVALALAGCFAWLFGSRWMRWGVMLVAAIGMSLLIVCQMQGRAVGPLGDWVRALPPHAQDRVLAMFNPFEAGSSDLARVRWLIDSAGTTGWGLGYVPWQGVAAARAQDGLPLQGPSDYVLALTAAAWGQPAGLALMAAVLTVFASAAAVGLRQALRPAMPPVVRWLAALGGLGCTMMATKVVLSVGGVTGVLPLTGLPVGLLGYGPVTHVAALVYLSLALGTQHVRPDVGEPRGVCVQPQPEAGPSARRRSRWLGWICLGALAALLLSSLVHLREGVGERGVLHLARARWLLAQDVAAALVPADRPEGVTAWPCHELASATEAWNVRLATLSRPVAVGKATTSALRLDARGLLMRHPVDGASACRTLARTLGQMLDNDMPRLLGREAVRHDVDVEANGTQPTRVFDQPRTVGAHALDYSTANAWRGQPGCVVPAEALGRDTQPGTCTRTQADVAGEVATDPWLRSELASRLRLAVREPVGRRLVNHHEIGVGPTLGVTLQPALQAWTQQMAECFTGRLHGKACESVVPTDGTWRARYADAADALRAGALGLVVAEVDSGRVVALAGAVSDCSQSQLMRAAQADAQGRTPALLDGSRCAQLPDRRSAWLAREHPALWLVPPGSALKPFSLVAGIDAGLLEPGSDAYWKRILAESHEREPIQRIALAAGQRYLDVLAGVGYERPAASRDLLWGGPAREPGPMRVDARWTHRDYDGSADLRATSMPLEQAERIRRQKSEGQPVDQQYGPAVMREFLAARRLADASVGGGDIRINALGLVDAWRSIDLRARGHREAPALHLLERPGLATPARSLGWLSPQASLRALGMTTGVTASALNGTAQGSCRVVFGHCPPEGVPTLSGKTGSADFLTEEDAPYVKPGLQLPAKLFGGVFTARGGRRYAVAVMALRVREGSSRTLELKASAAAEAALLLMRHLQGDARLSAP